MDEEESVGQPVLTHRSGSPQRSQRAAQSSSCILGNFICQLRRICESTYSQGEPNPQAPGYGFPESTKGLLPWSWAEQRLKKSHNYWITTVKQDAGEGRAAHDGGLGVVAGWAVSVLDRKAQSRKARNLAENPNCIVCTEHAHEAIIVEGVAEIADVAARKKMLPAYERKYKFDMSTMKDDILSMKEPVFAVRPRVVFADVGEAFPEQIDAVEV